VRLSGRNIVRQSILALFAVVLLTGTGFASTYEVDLTSGKAWWTIGESSDEFSFALESPSQKNSKVTFSLAETDKEYLAKDPLEAFLRSALLPGWGQRYGERYSRGTIFTSIEVGLWAGLLLSRESYKTGKDNYISYAREHAGVVGSKSHDFYVDIGNYDSQAAYNRDQLQRRITATNIPAAPISGNGITAETDTFLKI
jgi:hypothetical protein